MSDLALERAQAIAREVVLALGGYGLFGVELFVCGDEVIFSEVSPRPHDTGMVTLISQDLSEFALHVRAFLGLPVGAIRQYGPAASAVILPQLSSQNVSFGQLQSAVGAGLQLRLFGKPEIDGTRRLGVTLAVADSVEEAVARAKAAAAAVIARLSLLRINARAVDGCPAVKATSTDIPASARLTPASLAPVKSSASTSTLLLRSFIVLPCSR